MKGIMDRLGAKAGRVFVVHNWCYWLTAYVFMGRGGIPKCYDQLIKNASSIFLVSATHFVLSTVCYRLSSASIAS